METKRRAVQLGVLTVLFLILFAQSGQGVQVNYAENGTVHADGQSFSSLEEFHSSEYFHKKGLRCGFRSLEVEPDPRIVKNINDCTKNLTAIQSEYWPEAVYQVQVWWHVITDGSGTGNISQAVIEEQMKVLNEDYRASPGTMGANGYDTKIEFTLAGITRTSNTSWFNDSDEYGYKSSLQRDPSNYLNIYTNTASGYLGYSYLPQDVFAGSGNEWRDGIVLNYMYVGGRNNGAGSYDQGRTLVHEMGHYFGLLHTFEGDACFNSYSAGDLIVDTNAQNVSTDSCTSLSTCPSPAPIHNYMDYSIDTCMWEFTREQANRTVCGLVNYRPSLFTVLSENGDPTMPPLLMPLILKN